MDKYTKQLEDMLETLITQGRITFNCNRETLEKAIWYFRDGKLSCGVERHRPTLDLHHPDSFKILEEIYWRCLDTPCRGCPLWEDRLA